MNLQNKVIFTAIILLSLSFFSPVQAQEHGSKAHPKKEAHSKKEGCHKPCKPAHKQGHSGHKGGLHLFSPDWHGTLSDHQSVMVDNVKQNKLEK